MTPADLQEACFYVSEKKTANEKRELKSKGRAGVRRVRPGRDSLQPTGPRGQEGGCFLPTERLWLRNRTDSLLKYLYYFLKIIWTLIALQNISPSPNPQNPFHTSSLKKQKPILFVHSNLIFKNTEDSKSNIIFLSQNLLVILNHNAHPQWHFFLKISLSDYFMRKKKSIQGLRI